MAADTQTLKYIIEFNTTNAKAVTAVLDSMKRMNEGLDVSYKKTSVSAKNWGDIMMGIASRAMLTIPVWMAFRTALQATQKTITDTVQYIGELDAAMRKMQAVSGAAGAMPAFTNSLMKNVEALSGQTGKSVKDISEIYIAFAETGMNAALAQDSMTTALKLAVGTFSDTKDTARILVDLYNMFGSTMDKALSPAQKMQLISGDMVSLWKDNSGTLKEYIDGLRQFAPIAKANNLSMQETLTTLVVLNNYMQRGSGGGTQLARAFQDIAKNAPKLRELGMPVTPGKEMDTFVNILAKLASMPSSDRFSWLNSIFGQRSQKGVGALGAADALERLLTQLDKVKNMDVASANKLLNENFDLQNKGLINQANAFDQLRKQAGAAFLIGVTGSSNVTEALNKLGEALFSVNSFMRDSLIPSFKSFGDTLNFVFGNSAVKFFNDSLNGIIAKMIRLSNTFNPIALTMSFVNSLTPSTRKSFLESVTEARLSGKPIGPILSKRPYGVTNEQIYDAYSKGIAAAKAAGAGASNPTGAPLPIAIEDTFTPKQQLAYAERLKSLGYDTLQIEIEKYRIISKTSTDELKIKEQGLKVLEAQIALVNEYASIVQKNLESSITKVMQGQAGAGSIMTSLQTSAVQGYQKTVSEGVTNMIMSTGIGEMFGMSMSSLKGMFGGVSGQIESAFDSGGKQTYAWIVRGFQDAKNGTANPAIMAQSGGVGGMMGMAAAPFGGFASKWANSTALSWGPSYANPLTYVSPYGASKGYQVGQAPGASANKLTWGQIGSSALLGYSAYQSSRASGASSAMSATSGIGMGLGSALLASGLGAASASLGAGAGLMATMGAMGPVGWAGLALMGVGLAAGIFGGGKKSKQESSQTTVSENSVASKVDFSNKQLQMVNRNLVALRQDITTYILPNSAYFSTARNLSDEFSISSRRG